MAVPVQTPFIEYVANGVTTNFSLGFDCEDQSHLIVTVDDIEPITGSWSLLAGAVVFNSAPLTDSKIIIKRNSPFERDRDFQLYDQSFRPPAVNLDLDRIWRKLQELGVMDWILGNRIDDLKNYVDEKDNELRASLLAEIQAQGVSLDQLEAYYNYLMQRLAEIAVNLGWEASFVVDASGETQQQINDKSPVFCDTVAQLRTLKPRTNGAVMFVKSNSDNNSGGLIYIWDEYSESADDGGSVIKSDLFTSGRWVADFGNAPITPRDFGAKGDGVADERLYCEKSIVVARNLKKTWLVPHGDVYLLNSYANYSEIASFTGGMLPIFSNVNYEIQGTLKVGAFFDDKDFIVFTDVNAATPAGWTPVKNWSINGMGNIDLSLSGKRRTTYKLRIPIYLETSYDAEIKSIKIHDGDTPNAIVTGGKNITIDGVHFVDLMQDNSANDDHSSIYAKAENTVIKNCNFEMNTVNGHLNACPVELHNSNSSFKDSVIKGYRNTHIIAAIFTEFPNIENIEVSDLKAEVYRNFSTLDVWTGATLINAQIHDNIINMLPFPSDTEITNAGIDPLTVDGSQTMVLATNDSAVGFNLVAGIGSNINYYDNIYISEPDANIADNLRSAVYFYKAPVSGISVYNNTIRSKNIILASDGVQATDKLNIDRMLFNNNEFDESFFSSLDLINLSINKIQSSTFKFSFKRNFTCNSLIKLVVADTANSIVNNFFVEPQNTSGISNCLNITQAVLDNTANKLMFPANVSVNFGADVIGDSDFYMSNIKSAKIIGRGAIPDNISFSEFLSNNGNNRLVAICRNPSGAFGYYTARMLLKS